MRAAIYIRRLKGFAITTGIRVYDDGFGDARCRSDLIIIRRQTVINRDPDIIRRVGVIRLPVTLLAEGNEMRVIFARAVIRPFANAKCRYRHKR